MSTDGPGPFEGPPRQFTDAQGREISIREFDPGREATDTEAIDTEATNREPAGREALVEMYHAFDPEDRAQGIPPVGEAAIREWLDTLLGSDCFNVVARHGERVVGHATLVPDRQGGHELAIFVLRPYQNAGIGTDAMVALLGLARREGGGRIWLTVERWNDPAIALYRKVGFEPITEDSFEMEMELRLDEGREGSTRARRDGAPADGSRDGGGRNGPSSVGPES